MSLISETFRCLKEEGRAALMPYLSAGHPSLECTEALLPAVAAAGADMIELGIPYSDPLADGPTIQRAGQKALEVGATIAKIHALVRRVKEKGLSIPVLYMVYYNCIYRHGEERFLDEAVHAGVSGLIVPDLPLEEAERLDRLALERELDLIYLLAPTSTSERIRLTAERARGFIYCVSVTGVTGARRELSDAILPLVKRIRSETDLPLAVGFGVSTPEQASTVGMIADGVIVGSALIERIDRANGPDEAVQSAVAYIASLRRAMDRARSNSVQVG